MALATAGAALGFTASASAQQRRPNFLFILSDDQRWDAMSNMPNRWPFLRTPSIDRLATEGARFDNAFVSISLCSPSRACFLTGRYAHNHGVVTNEGQELAHDIPTYPQLLQRAGYRTAHVGKWHMGEFSDPRPGFDYWLSFVGQGVYTDPALQENDRKFQATGYITDLLTDYAVNWLKAQDGPFCLSLCHKAVHGPFTPAPRHANAFPDAEIAEPPNWCDTLRGKPAWMRRERLYGAQKNTADKPVPDEVSVGKWNPRNRGNLDYLRCVLGVDESVGRVLDTLAQMGQLDNTVIIFAGDNGFFIGEHGRGDKRLAYEESMRIPFLMRYPAVIRPGSRIAPMALNVDLDPTVLDLAGVAPPAGVQGRSLRPVLAGQTGGGRKSFLYEYFRERWLPGISTMLGVRGERWKYTTYPDLKDLDELYDLQNDPGEMTNLATDPAHADQLREMRAELERLKAETGYHPPVRQIVMKNVPFEAVLAFDFTKDEGAKVVDSSGKGNDGQAHGAALTDDGAQKARRFSGKDYIEVGKSASLDPSHRAFTVAATYKAERPDGVLLARGGQSNGYALRLKGGKPEFAVRAGGALCSVAAPQAPTTEWVSVVGVLAKDLRMTLYVNGKPVATATAEDPIPADPNEALQIGLDRGSLVGEYPVENGFAGLIRDVHLYSGEAAPKP